MQFTLFMVQWTDALIEYIALMKAHCSLELDWVEPRFMTAVQYPSFSYYMFPTILLLTTTKQITWFLDFYSTMYWTESICYVTC